MNWECLAASVFNGGCSANLPPNPNLRFKFHNTKLNLGKQVVKSGKTGFNVYLCVNDRYKKIWTNFLRNKNFIKVRFT